MGAIVSGYSKPLLIARYSTVPAASATVNILPIWPCFGWGTLRVYAEADVAVTLNIFQKERASTPGTFRRTDQDTIPATPGFTQDYLICGEYLRIQIAAGGTAPTRFVLVASLWP